MFTWLRILFFDILDLLLLDDEEQKAD